MPTFIHKADISQLLLFCEQKNRMDVVDDNISHKGLLEGSQRLETFQRKFIHMTNKRPAEQIYIPYLITCDCGF